MDQKLMPKKLNKKRTFSLILSYLICFSFFSENLLIARESSYPYISGDTFRSFCDFIYDETGNTVIPDQVKYGDVIFLKTDFLQEFYFHVHPAIINPYILITHNSDRAITQEFKAFLEDPKLIAWFGQNLENFSHSKLHPIPIGIANRIWEHGSIAKIAETKKKTKGCQKNTLLYMNFSPSTYPPLRPYVYQLFSDQAFCKVGQLTDFGSYLFDVAHAKFVLSPRGNGLDCHRTWEAIYMGSIPIVESSTIDPLFKELPVLIINNWNDVKQKFLEEKWEEMSKRDYQNDRMYADYWFDLISSYKIPKP